MCGEWQSQYKGQGGNEYGIEQSRSAFGITIS
jgi:hypothetical protein